MTGLDVIRNGESSATSATKTLTAKTACRCATTANITLSGLQTIDTVSVVEGDRVLVKDQADDKTNGIYLASAGAWVRAGDANENTFLVSGTSVFIYGGTTNLATMWTLKSAESIIIGTSSIVFTRVDFHVHDVGGSDHTGTITDAQHGSRGAIGNAHAHTDLSGVTATQHHTNANDPTANEKAALAGTSGTAPSASDKFVDDSDTRNTNSRTPIVHTNALHLNVADNPHGLSEHNTGSARITVGLDASKPAASTADQLYFATDTLIVYRDTGVAWSEVVRGEAAIRLASLSEKNHGSLANVSANDHHNQSHNHSAAGDGQTVAPTTLVAPAKADPASPSVGEVWQNAGATNLKFRDNEAAPVTKTLMNVGDAPTAHASTHQNSGGDEVATATAGANAIPKAGAGGKLDKAWVPDFVASGVSHASGGVPDPGAVSGSTKFLREDATFAVPSSGTPATTVTDETGFAVAKAVGTSSNYAREDHTHGSEPHDAHGSLTGVTADQHHAQAHHAAHEPAGADAMAVDAVAATGSLRTLGTGAQQAAAGNDSRLSDSRTPTAHAASHRLDGSDAVLINRKPTGAVTIPAGYCLVLAGYLDLTGSSGLTLQGDAALKII